ncbi:hypothetical protein DERP_007811 [Dermatophagoides pteronyssinus]|uniref:Uncharacterized protein n=1 Tax=Dermatophagoides pteronyssinus TaxID=6956 RepID=A0ABQ8ISP0_DERPT|nr:hypothetical protein DERP_007811 [Dermatophagoides pteronyssinus]
MFSYWAKTTDNKKLIAKSSFIHSALIQEKKKSQKRRENDAQERERKTREYIFFSFHFKL